MDEGETIVLRNALGMCVCEMHILVAFLMDSLSFWDVCAEECHGAKYGTSGDGGCFYPGQHHTGESDVCSC